MLAHLNRLRWMSALQLFGFLMLFWIGLTHTGCFTMRTPDRKWPQEMVEQGQIRPIHMFDAEGTDGRTIHAVAIGLCDSLPVVVGVHGSPGSSSAFADYLADTILTARAGFIAIDRPGFGYSDFGHPETSLQKQALDIKALLDEGVPGRKVILVGHSLGGPLIVRFAMDHPEMVSGLVIVAGSVDPDLEPHPWWQKPLDHWPLKWLIPRSMRTSNHEIIGLEAELRSMLPLWPSIHCPVRILHATDDRLVPFANSAFAEEHLTGVLDLKLDTMHQGDHFILWNHRKRVVDAILDLASP